MKRNITPSFGAATHRTAAVLLLNLDGPGGKHVGHTVY